MGHKLKSRLEPAQWMLCRAVWINQRQGSPARFDRWFDRSLNLHHRIPRRLDRHCTLGQSNQTKLASYPGSRFHWAEEANPLEPIIDTHPGPLDTRHCVESKRRQERQCEKAMRNGPSKRRFALGSLTIGVNELMIMGGVGKHVDHRLIDCQPIRHVLGPLRS
jgi:hypothetical protein